MVPEPLYISTFPTNGDSVRPGSRWRKDPLSIFCDRGARGSDALCDIDADVASVCLLPRFVGGPMSKWCVSPPSPFFPFSPPLLPFFFFPSSLYPSPSLVRLVGSGITRACCLCSAVLSVREDAYARRLQLQRVFLCSANLGIALCAAVDELVCSARREFSRSGLLNVGTSRYKFCCKF